MRKARITFTVTGLKDMHEGPEGTGVDLKVVSFKIPLGKDPYAFVTENNIFHGWVTKNIGVQKENSELIATISDDGTICEY